VSHITLFEPKSYGNVWTFADQRGGDLFMIRRREFIAGLGSVATWPLVARAQQGERIRRVGFLVASEENDQVSQTGYAAFRDGMAKLGWVEGRNLRIDRAYGGHDPERLQTAAARLIELGPDVIFTGTVSGTRAAQQQTQTIPIVFMAVGDPVGNGIVKNIARPEGNATGITNILNSIAGKWVELLKEAAPEIKRVGLLHNAQLSFPGYLPAIEQAASILTVPSLKIPYHDLVEMVHGVDAFAAEPNGGMIVVPPTPTIEGRRIINRLAVTHRLPTVYIDKSYVVEGGLMSYGASSVAFTQRASYFVDRIFRGAKISELPVELPTRFELVVNARTAKTIGLTIPEPFLFRADEVIEE
jgi:putative tryptophan/tyrosine transport system substrate-binding protein